MSKSHSPRRILHERSPSHNNELARIRLVPSTPPRLLGRDGTPIDDLYSRTPLPTHPNHCLGPGRGKGKGTEKETEKSQGKGKENGEGKGKGRAPGRDQGSHTPELDLEFHRTTTHRTTTKVQAQRSFSGASVSSVSTTQTHQSQRLTSATACPSSRQKPPAKKRLHILQDNKTFSLLQDDASKSPTHCFSTCQGSSDSSDSLPLAVDNAGDQSNSTTSCAPQTSSALIPATPTLKSRRSISADHITGSPWNYQLVGGLRKVPKTPDLQQTVATSSERPLPPLPETSDETPPTKSVSHDLSTKQSFVSTETTTTTSENNNYIVHASNSVSTSEAAPPSSSGSNYQIIGGPSPPESVIDRTRTSPSHNDSNYQLHEDFSLANSHFDLVQPARYSQESLVVPPLNTKLCSRRSNETLGYHKSPSRESLRTGSLTSIATVLSQQEAFRAIVGSGALIQLPILKQRQKRQGSSSWAEPPSLVFHPPRSQMNEHPHQWSSQLSTVLSVSDCGTDRNSRSWSIDNGRRSSGYPSSQSRHSRQMLSISSSVVQEEASSRSRSNSIEPPTPVFARNGRHNSGPSIRMVEDMDEYGDGITDMQDLRGMPSRTRLSSYFNSASSDNGRTNTMRSTTSSRANSLLSGSIPTWAKLYYGSGERRYIGTSGTDSRSNSIHAGSPNTDHFPSSVYSPRRRQQDINAASTRGSLDITSASQLGDDGRFNTNDPCSRRFRTWSMSSIWSPHLRLDRRATRRSVWEPPSVNWSTEGGWFGRRNVQIVMFIVGFIFPFAWMIAAILPLPPRPTPNMSERDDCRSNPDSSHDREAQHQTPNDYRRQLGPMDEARYDSAKRWRRLNRCMSFVGVLVLVTIAVLVYIGIEQGW